WNLWSRLRWAGGVGEVGAALGGRMKRCAVHQLPQSPSDRAVTSGSQPSMPKPLMTMREPGLSSRNFGASLLRFSVNRKSASTVACEISASYMPPCTNSAFSDTPSFAAFRCASLTMSSLYSTPSARAPRLAAAITLRPSPEPRSMTKSRGVTAAMSSIFSTSAWGVGTQTTSLPAWPTIGSKGFSAACWASATPPANTTRQTADDNRNNRLAMVNLLSSMNARLVRFQADAGHDFSSGIVVDLECRLEVRGAPAHRLRAQSHQALADRRLGQYRPDFATESHDAFGRRAGRREQTEIGQSDG